MYRLGAGDRVVGFNQRTVADILTMNAMVGRLIDRVAAIATAIDAAARAMS